MWGSFTPQERIPQFKFGKRLDVSDGKNDNGKDWEEGKLMVQVFLHCHKKFMAEVLRWWRQLKPLKAFELDVKIALSLKKSLQSSMPVSLVRRSFSKWQGRSFPVLPQSESVLRPPLLCDI